MLKNRKMFKFKKTEILDNLWEHHTFLIKRSSFSDWKGLIIFSVEFLILSFLLLGNAIIKGNVTLYIVGGLLGVFSMYCLIGLRLKIYGARYMRERLGWIYTGLRMKDNLLKQINKTFPKKSEDKKKVKEILLSEKVPSEKHFVEVFDLIRKYK